MNINESFPSSWLKASDLQGREVSLTISHVVAEDISGDHKPVMYFQSTDRGLVLNKTNSYRIAADYGQETDNWRGKPIVLYSEKVTFQGRMVDGIRVRVPQQGAAAGGSPFPAPANSQGQDDRQFQSQQPPEQPPEQPPVDINSDIPF